MACGGKGLELLVKKHQLVCQEAACPKRIFVRVTDQIPMRSRLTTRLVGEIVEDAVHELCAVTGIARAHVAFWPTVMRRLLVIEQIVLDVDQRLVRQLGVDEHRFRRVRFVLGTTRKMMRVEPWSIVFTDLDTGTILDIVYGRRGKMTDPAYKYRKFLGFNLERLSNKQTEWLKTVDRESFAAVLAKLETSVKPRIGRCAKSLFRTLTVRKTELEIVCPTRLINALSEAANPTTKNIKRIGRR